MVLPAHKRDVARLRRHPERRAPLLVGRVLARPLRVRVRVRVGVRVRVRAGIKGKGTGRGKGQGSR